MQQLLAMLRWRATEPAFHGTFELLDTPDHLVSVRWSTGSTRSTVTVTVDVRTGAIHADPALPFLA